LAAMAWIRRTCDDGLAARCRSPGQGLSASDR
jgi:hypothetical protein